ncbi:MAG: glycosyltransferase family 2 protein [Lentisphaeria bacterium]|nr:glycosyltransferase family 2 protein [Lentisphaeria bacterium]
MSRICPGIRIVVINDGSTDDTASRLRSLDIDGMTVIEMPVNSGIGNAVQTGLIFARRNGADYAVKFDGDGQHLPEEIAALMTPLLEKRADLVIGSRFLKKNDGFRSTFLRRVGIKFFRFLSVVLTGHVITDTTSGFRAYNRRALDFAAKYYPSFDYPEPEEGIMFLRNGLTVSEVACKMAERRAGKSSIRPLRACYYMVKVTFAMVMERMRPMKTGEVEI